MDSLSQKHYVVVNNHTLNGSTAASAIPGNDAAKRDRFKETVLQTIMEFASASAASRGRESGKHHEVWLAGDWNLQFANVEKVQQRHGGGHCWWVIGHNRDFVLSTFPCLDAVKTFGLQPVTAHDRVHQALLAKAVATPGILLTQNPQSVAEDEAAANDSRFKYLARKLLSLWRGRRASRHAKADVKAREEELEAERRAVQKAQQAAEEREREIAQEVETAMQLQKKRRLERAQEREESERQMQTQLRALSEEADRQLQANWQAHAASRDQRERQQHEEQQRQRLEQQAQEERERQKEQERQEKQKCQEEGQDKDKPDSEARAMKHFHPYRRCT